MTEVLDASVAAQRAGWPTWFRAVWVHAYTYSKVWKGSVTTTFLFPLLYLAAMGVGLGTLVDRHAHHVGGVAYVDFLAPGLLAGTIFQVAVNESTYPVMARIKWMRTYWAMLATPLDIDDVLIGHLGWSALRGGMVSGAFLLVMEGFGVIHSWWALAALPLAMAASVAFAAPTTAYAATTTSENGFALLYRFGVMPLFLFSATFFPLGQLPLWLRAVAQCTPLLHAVNLLRDCTLGTGSATQALVDVVYLAVFAAVGIAFARRAFRKRMVL